MVAGYVFITFGIVVQTISGTIRDCFEKARGRWQFRAGWNACSGVTTWRAAVQRSPRSSGPFSGWQISRKFWLECSDIGSSGLFERVPCHKRLDVDYCTVVDLVHHASLHGMCVVTAHPRWRRRWRRALNAIPTKSVLRSTSTTSHRFTARFG